MTQTLYLTVPSEAYVGDTVGVMVSGLIYGLPYRLYRNSEMVVEKGFTGLPPTQRVEWFYHECTEEGVFNFQAWQWSPNDPLGVTSTPERLTVLAERPQCTVDTDCPTGYRCENNLCVQIPQQNGNGSGSMVILPILIALILIVVLFMFMGSRKK